MKKLPLQDLLTEISRCQHCAAELPQGARPVVVADPRASILVIGQAPGLKVHRTGIPWNDSSGDRLRDWLQLTPTEFYDAQRLAIMPMGFCYPGRGRSGDRPPQKECAPKWHGVLRENMPNVRLTLLIGLYAQNYYLADRSVTLTRNVRDFDHFSGIFPLPHPSPRNNLWLSRNPWFEREVLPVLRKEVFRCLYSGGE